MLALLVLAAASARAADFVGADRCITCHVREGDVWTHSRHFRSFEALSTHPKTRDLERAVGGRAACAHCHYTVVQEHAVSGPSCESCHGPASAWLPVHANLDLPLAQRRRAAHAQGLRDHTDLFAVARACMECHGLNHPALDGDTLRALLAAGHSIEPTYELEANAQADVRHRFYPVPHGTENRPRSPEERAHLVLVGQLVRLLSARDAAARSRDAGYRAAQLQREELAREALAPLAAWPPVAAFLAAPDEPRARAVLAAAEAGDRTRLVHALLPPRAPDALPASPAAPALPALASLPAAAGRWLESLAGVAGTALRRGLPASPRASAPPVTSPPEEPQAPRAADEALEALLAGNLRFAAGRSRPVHESAAWRKQLTAGQHPFAVVLSCSDSRVPVELIFDQGFGDLFVIRVAGNVFSPDTAGSILYAVHHLHTRLVFVMGHEACGAVTAALDYDPSRSREPAPIQDVLALVAPAVREVDAAAPPGHRLSEAIKENVRRTIRKLREDPEIRHAEQQGGLLIVGGVYQISTGAVYRISERLPAPRAGYTSVDVHQPLPGPRKAR